MIKKTRLIRTTQELIRINSENPPGREKGIARYVADKMRRLGVDVRTYTFKKDRPNIIAILHGSLPRRKAAKESLLLTPHYDTVPAGGGWRFGPFSGKVIKGKIYGRGASDDKGNLACAMEVFQSLREDGVRLKKDIILAATADEETGSHYGIIPLLEKNILKPKMALILDSDEFDTIIAQKGLIHARIQIFGKKAHGAYNWRGINAIEVAAKIITDIKKHRFSFHKHAFLRSPTVNIGVIKGGDKTNIVADFCEFSIDIRYLPGTSPFSVLKDVRGIIRRETKQYKISIDDIQYPYEIEKDHLLVKLYASAAHKLKVKAILKGSEGATVISFFKKRKIPAIATGYGAHNTAHITDEYAKISTLYQGAKVLEQFIKDYDAL